jgi:hypothetical protein
MSGAVSGWSDSIGEHGSRLVAPRCVDKAAAAEYLGGVSVDQIERLIQAGHIPIVRLPAERHRRTGRGITGTCRRVLIDTRDLDRLIEKSKEQKT